jgi:hypothetical protein
LLFNALVALLVYEPAKLCDLRIFILIMATLWLAIASWVHIPILHTLVEPESDLCFDCLALVGCAMIIALWIEVFAPGLVVGKLGCVLNGVLRM